MYMAVDVGSARVEIRGDVRRFARETEQELNQAVSKINVDPVKVRADTRGIIEDLDRTVSEMGPVGKRAGQEFGDGFLIGSDGRIKDSQGRFVRMGTELGGSAGSAAGRAFTSMFGKGTDSDKIKSLMARMFLGVGKAALNAFIGPLSAGLSILPSLIGPALVVAGIGIASGIAAVVGPALGGLIASAVLAAGGLGVIGLGAFLLREEPELIRAAKSLMSTVKDVFTSAAKPLLEPLVGALGIFEKMIERIGPMLRSAFGAIGPAIEPFAKGLAGMVEESLPGFLELVGAARPLLQGMASVLPGLGTSFSNFFDSIASAGPEATEFFKDFIGWVGQFIESLGRAIAWLARAYVAVKNFLGPLPDILREAWTAFREGASAGEVFDILEKAFDPGFFDRVVESIKGVVTNGLNYLANNAGSIIETIVGMKSAVLDAAIKVMMGIAEALPEVIPQLVSGAVSLITALINGLVASIPRLVEAASLLINGLVDGLVAALPQILQGAVQIVTSMLTGIVTLLPVIIQAGLRLIQGLIEGIMKALPQIQMALIQVAPKIIEALITVLPQLLTLGAKILEVIIQGIGDNLPMLLDTVRTQVIPMLIDTFKTEGPRLLEMAGEMIRTIANGFIDSIGTIAEVITGTIIPAIVDFFTNGEGMEQGGANIIDKIADGLANNIPKIAEFISNTLIPGAVNALQTGLPKFLEGGGRLIISLLIGIVQAAPKILSTIITSIIPAMIRAVLTVLPAMVNAGNRIIGSLVSSLASAWAKQSKSNLNAIKNGITNFFSGAAGWLVSAGRRIIEGLISGIKSMIGSLKGVLNSITGMIPDWKGPAEVDRRILRESGRMVMQGFQFGIEDQRDAIERTLRNFTSDIPTFVGGPVRGGDGAPSSMAVNFGPGSIVINGQGGEAGRDAAEAILEHLGQARGMM